MSRRIPRTTWLFLGLCCALLVMGPLTLAQSDGEYDLSWWTVDGGGGTLSGAGSSAIYTLTGAVAQPDAGVLGDGTYALVGGFWVGAVSIGPQHNLYLPIVVRGQP
jgi:hypothetical protein